MRTAVTIVLVGSIHLTSDAQAYPPPPSSEREMLNTPPAVTATVCAAMTAGSGSGASDLPPSHAANANNQVRVASMIQASTDVPALSDRSGGAGSPCRG